MRKIAGLLIFSLLGVIVFIIAVLIQIVVFPDVTQTTLAIYYGVWITLLLAAFVKILRNR